MLETAYEFGLSEKYNLEHFLPESTGNLALKLAWDAFLQETPEFNDGSFSNEPADNNLLDEPLSDLVERELALQRAGILLGATVIKTYERHYTPESEGTGWHEDTKTGADLIIVHTVYGSALFDAIRVDGTNYSAKHSAGDVIAFKASTQHNASPPTGCNRLIEGIAIKLAH